MSSQMHQPLVEKLPLAFVHKIPSPNVDFAVQCVLGSPSPPHPDLSPCPGPLQVLLLFLFTRFNVKMQSWLGNPGVTHSGPLPPSSGISPGLSKSPARCRSSDRPIAPGEDGRSLTFFRPKRCGLMTAGSRTRALTAQKE